MILWINAKFYTMNKEGEYVNKVITKNGVIVAVGDECNNQKTTKTIDLKGSFVFPGFSDAHIHLIGYGRKLFSKHLNFEKNKVEVLNKIKDFYNNQDLKIEGYFDVGITKDELDLISNEHYIILRHNDYHAFSVNSKVLKDLNLKSIDGIIKSDFLSKQINKLWETNSDLELTKYTSEAITSLKQLGITSVHTDDLAYFNGYENTLEILNNLSLKHHFRINALIHNQVLSDYINQGFPNNNYLNPIQFKYFYDGTLSSKTALLSHNYKDDISNGEVYLDEVDFIKQLKKLRELGKGVAVHVIGDQGLDNVLKLLNKIPSTKELDRIVHGSLAKPNVIVNVPIDIQPIFKIEDKDIINETIDFEVLKYPFKLYNKQTIINGSSDAPVSDPNPLLGIYYLNDISRYDAIKAYTVNPYKTINKKGGVIKAGYYADFTCFDQDILKIESKELLKTKVKYTIINEQLNIK